MQVTIELRTVACGTEVNICQSGIPESIPVEFCYLGWQESLKMLPRVVEPDWKKVLRAIRHLRAGVNAMTRKKPVKSAQGEARATAKPDAGQPKLLSGGNPQIAKGDGDAPVQAYISAMPGWKRDVGSRLDAIITCTVPNVRKAVRWNTPFYGIEGQGWFLAFHCITKYVKVTFFRGASLQPVPPVASKQKDVRYFHIHEVDHWDEELVVGWIRQASELPGETCF